MSTATERARDICKKMRNRGADERQYIILTLGDIEEMLTEIDRLKKSSRRKRYSVPNNLSDTYDLTQ